MWIVSAGKVTSSVLTVFGLEPKHAHCKCDEASNKRLMRVNFCQSLHFGHCVQCLSTLAAKFLPLKMLTVLSFLIFPYFYSLYRFFKRHGSRECAVCLRDAWLGDI